MPEELTDEQLIEQARSLKWEEVRQGLIVQTQREVYAQLRAIQVTLAIGTSNGDFPTTFRTDIKTLLMQMVVMIEVRE